MPHIRTRIKTGKPESDFDKTLEQELLSFANELSNVINGGIRIDENLNASIVTIADTGSANAENTLAHGLKRVPIGFLVINTNKAVSAYDSGTAWTATNIYLKFNTANCTVKVLIF